MDKEILYELRQAYIDGWLSREEIIDSFQRRLITYSEYLWIIGALDIYKEKRIGTIILEE